MSARAYIPVFLLLHLNYSIDLREQNNKLQLFKLNDNGFISNDLQLVPRLGIHFSIPEPLCLYVKDRDFWILYP
jgi:hypothetical protein